MRDRRDLFDVDDDAAGVGEVLDKDRLGPRGHRAAEILRIGRVDKMAGPAELLERQAELGQGAAIEVARGDELIARLHQREKHQELRGVARGRRDRGAATFEAGDALFEHRHGRIGEARIDVAEIVQVEERGGMVDILEDIGCRLVDRGRARPGHRIRRGTGMHRAGLEAVALVVRSRRELPDSARSRGLRRAVLDDAAVDAAPRQFAAEPAELDLWAAVHDDFDPGALGARGRRVVADAELHPHHRRADRDRVLDNAGRLGRRAEYVDHVDGLRNVAQRGVDPFAEQFLAGDPGVDRDHAVALPLQILHHEIARPVPVGRGADHGDCVHPLEDRADLRVGIRDRIELAHGTSQFTGKICRIRPILSYASHGGSVRNNDVGI